MTKKEFLRFYSRFLSGLKGRFIFSVFMSLISILFTFLIPQAIRFTADSVIGNTEAALPSFLSPLKALTDHTLPSFKRLLLSGTLILICAALAGLTQYFSKTAIAACAEGFTKNLRDTLMRHILHLPFSWHSRTQTGDIIQRCTSDVETVREFISKQLLEVIRILLLILTAVIIMFTMNVPLALISFAFIPVIILYSLIFHIRISGQFRKADEAEGELMVAVQENLTGIQIVHAFGMEKREKERFTEKIEAYASKWIDMGTTLGIYWGVGDLSSCLELLAVVCAGSFFAATGNLTIGEFLAFIAYTQNLTGPVRSLGRTLSEFSKSTVSVERLSEVLNAEEEPEEPNALKPDLSGDIVFSHVTFSYGENEILHDLSFTVKKGTVFGILGATGSGKSTLVSLLNRLYPLPRENGSISIGGVDIRGIDRTYLRRNIGLVLQEPFLFSETIEENIAIAAPEDFSTAGDEGARKTIRESSDRFREDARKASGGDSDRFYEDEREGSDRFDEDTPEDSGRFREDVRRAARISAVDDAIMDFPDKYATLVGERGVTLSGGQKQRIAIARTLLLNCPVMVLDDSTSAVDMDTDAKIREALRKNVRQSTLILISHRISTLMQADHIIVLDHGRLAEEGTHDELIRREGIYRRVYDIQASTKDDEAPQDDIRAGAKEGGTENG